MAILILHLTAACYAYRALCCLDRRIGLRLDSYAVNIYGLVPDGQATVVSGVARPQLWQLAGVRRRLVAGWLIYTANAVGCWV